MSALRRRHRAGERGATLIIVALVLFALVVVVALVIDFGFLRNTRQSSKAATDATASAGLQSLAPDAVPRPWRAACSALGYLRANEQGRTLTVTYLDGDGTALAGNPCADLLTQTCVPNSPTSWAWIRATDGDFFADIRTGYVTPDPSFPEDAAEYAGDDGAAARGGCDQIAVIIGDGDPAFFGGIVGATAYRSVTRTVGRVDIQSRNEGAPAFVMLERVACGVLTTSVGTGGGQGIIVEPASATEPGIIHVDSSGAVGCGGGPESSYTVYSTTIGSNPGIEARGTTGTPSIPGILSLRAIGVGNAGTAVATTTGVRPDPVPGSVVSRRPVDDKYNPTGAPTITQLHASARADAVRTVAPAGYTTITTCSNHDSDATTAAATLVFVNCPGGYSPRNVAYPVATDVIVNGPVQVSNNRTLHLPVARRVVIGGNGSRGLEVGNGGRLGINTGAGAIFADSAAGVAGACTGRDGPGGNSTRLVVFGGGSTGSGAGALNVAGRAALCQTAAYLAGPSSNAIYARQAVTDGSTDATCTAVTPCPRSGGNSVPNAHLDVSGYLRWSAPNATSTQPAAGSVGVEDLALWTESANLSEVKSGGTLDSRGLFFLPNARLEMRSPAAATPRDAQFFSRSLKLFAGTLQMRPTAGNSVLVDFLAGSELVR